MERQDELRAGLSELAEGGREKLEKVRQDLTGGIPSRPLFGALPVRRVIPQDAHSVMDYAGAAALMAVGLISDDDDAKAVGSIVGAATIGASLLTDYRLSVAKVIPIEVHEILDYVVGLSSFVAPFAFGYRSRLARWLHAGIGISYIVASMFTDYRAQRGVGRRAFAGGV